MLKDKFNILDEIETKEVVTSAALTENTPTPAKEEKKTKDFAVKGFPAELHKAIVDNKDTTGNVNAFLRRACMKLAKEEGII